MSDSREKKKEKKKYELKPLKKTKIITFQELKEKIRKRDEKLNKINNDLLKWSKIKINEYKEELKNKYQSEYKEEEKEIDHKNYLEIVNKQLDVAKLELDFDKKWSEENSKFEEIRQQTQKEIDEFTYMDIESKKKSKKRCEIIVFISFIISIILTIYQYIKYKNLLIFSQLLLTILIMFCLAFFKIFVIS